MSRRRTMSKLDEDLTERFGKADRPLFVDPELFTGLLKRVRRERMKRVSTGGLVLAIALGGTMAYVIAERGASVRPASTATISPAVPSLATVGATIPGVPFPACHATSVTYFSEFSATGSVYLFGRGRAGTPCAELDSRNTYLGLNVGNLGPGPEPQIFGPIDCFEGCRIFGAPDIDGDGHVELAIVVGGSGADSIELYRVRPAADLPFTQMTTLIRGRRVPLAFDWGSAPNYRAGANCVTVGKPNSGLGDELDIWHAELRGTTWHLVQRFMAIDGDQVHLDHVERSSAVGADGFLPDGGGTDFCGASVTP
jgi:hypothetical protein